MTQEDATRDAEPGEFSSMRWFRIYDEILDDPKVLKLSLDMRWHYVAMMCIANKENKGGTLPDIEDVGIRLRTSTDEAKRIVQVLVAGGVLDRDAETQVLSVHGWSSRQFKSDDVTQRSSRSKAKKRERSHDENRNVPMKWMGNVVLPKGGNGPRTCATEQNRTDTEQIQNRYNADRVSDDHLGQEDPVEVPDWMPIDQWMDFCEMRVDMAKSDPSREWTRTAAKNAIGKLATFRAKGHDVSNILRDSVINRWRGIWEPKSAPGRPADKSPSSSKPFTSSPIADRRHRDPSFRKDVADGAR